MDSIPRLQALLLADQVFQDHMTGKFILAGVFHQLWVETFPARFPRPVYAFISMVGLSGEHSLSLRYCAEQENEHLLSTPPIPLTCSSAVEIIEFPVEIPPLVLPHPGNYSLQLAVDEQPLGSLALRVAPTSERRLPGEKNDE